MTDVLRALALVLAMLGLVVYAVYFYEASASGSYAIDVSLENATVRSIVIELPRGGRGELVYRVRGFTATLVYDGVRRELSPVFSRLSGGYPEVIEIPVALREGNYTVSGRFTLDEWSHAYNYSEYPWRLEIDGGQAYIYPAVRESLALKLILVLHEHSAPILLGLAVAAAGLASLHLLFGRGPLFQERGAVPPPPAPPPGGGASGAPSASGSSRYPQGPGTTPSCPEATSRTCTASS